ncbi:MAG: ABC transporter permease [Bryobacteraceae bacterium]
MAGELIRAVRRLQSAPGFAAIIVGLLALGIGAATAMFSVVNAVLLRPLPYGVPDRLVEIRTLAPSGRNAGVPLGDFDRLRAMEEIESIAFGAQGAVTLTGTEGAENVFSEGLAGDGLAVFGVAPSAGRLNGGERAVVLSHRLWQRRYQGDARVVGRAITVNGEPWTIGAVMPAGFFTTNRIFELWMPWRFSTDDLKNRQGYNGTTVARVTVPVPQLAARLEAERFGANNDVRGRAVSLWDRQDVDRARILWVLLGAVGLVLAIACLNAGSLMLARAVGRRRETAVRAALGARPMELLRPLAAESAVLAGCAASAGCLVAWGLLRALAAWMPERAPLSRMDEASLDVRMLGAAVGIAVASIVLAGLAPAFEAWAVRPAAALGDSSRASAGGRFASRFRAGAVVLQTALSVVVLVGAGLLMRSLVKMIETDPGYRREGLLTARIPMPFEMGQRGNPATEAHYRAVLDAVRAIPGVKSAAVTTVLPLGRVAANISFAPEGKAEPAEGAAQFYSVTPDYFRTMGVPLRAGRLFDERDTAGSPGVVIINEVAAKKYWPDEDPVGKRAAGQPPVVVAGVVGAVRRGSMREPPGPEVYRPFSQMMFGLHGTTLVLRTSGPAPESLTGPVRRTLRESFPDHPVAEIRTMEAVIADSVASPRFYASVFGLFAALALLLAGAGLYGLMAHSVAERRREIGIRAALGAPVAAIVGLIMSRGAVLLGAGVAAGVAGSVGFTRLLGSQLYEVDTDDPLTLTIVCGLLVAVGLIAVAGPARRAAGVDPASALRAE